MNCCANCFADREVIAFIETNSTQNGNCDFCHKKATTIIPASELLEIFQELFFAYLPIEDDIEHDGALLLFEQVKSWSIFKGLSDDAIKQLVDEIGATIQADNADLFAKRTIAKVLSDSVNQQQAEAYNVTWANFKDEIKSTNRFFIQNQFEFEKIKDILTSYKRVYKVGKHFYRARNSDKDGIAIDKMGRPPSLQATPGRANPRGISYLYLANDVKTTLYEVRAAIYDYVTVAEFRLKDEIAIVSLRHSERISPFQLEDIDKYLLYDQFVQSLHGDLKKPLRRQDTELEYLPTQYLCELIKFLGYDGIEYGSSMNPNGFNLALFNDDKIECISTKVYEIGSVTYAFNDV